MTDREPVIAVGLLPETGPVAVRLTGPFEDGNGASLPEGEYRVGVQGEEVRYAGPKAGKGGEVRFLPLDLRACRFSLEATIGVQFHWEQREVQSFAGAVRVLRAGGDRLTVINNVPLEVYLTSVICSEMSATSPPALVQAHGVVSRSWLLAQREAAGTQTPPMPPDDKGQMIRWYDSKGHATFDVCADDHCQRYHGVGRVSSAAAREAIHVTRGQVLTFDGRVCDARYAKACGGVTEDFRAAWSDVVTPYLVPLVDGPDRRMPDPPLTGEQAFRRFLDEPLAAYCNCSDAEVLDTILTPHDRATRDFFRWRVSISAAEVSRLVEEKLGLGLGRILALQPVERGLSGRIVRLRVTGETGEIVIGKELEIRRAFSPSHLYSSAFAVDVVGPRDRPDRFLLRGAGWGHGVGLCQIGAAVMAARGIRYQEILRHYYPRASLERLYR